MWQLSFFPQDESPISKQISTKNVENKEKKGETDFSYINVYDGKGKKTYHTYFIEQHVVIIIYDEHAGE